MRDEAALKERPILFSAPMVRALLAGTKTQTRRSVRDQDLVEYDEETGEPIHVHHPKCGSFCEYACGGFGLEPDGSLKQSPYGGPGDRLWVREAWCTAESLDDVRPSTLAERVPVHYNSDCAVRGKFRERPGRTRPGIHMPRWASRITLEVVGVRVERLHAITESDALAEGAAVGEPIDAVINGELGKAVFFNARDSFAHLWAGINGAESWKANPWVWVVEFRRVDVQERAA